MVTHCANSNCAKPLHYLRDGKVFLLNLPDARPDSSGTKREHFWLCGDCSTQFDLRQTGAGVEVVSKFRSRRPVDAVPPEFELAS
jgi:hypothetical protein